MEKGRIYRATRPGLTTNQNAYFPLRKWAVIGFLKLFLTKQAPLRTVVVSDFANLLCGKSYDRVERLAGLPSKIRHYQRDASVLLILADIFGACWGAMQSGKSAAKMGQNSSMWTHTRRPIRRGKITEMLIYFARNSKISPSWNTIDHQQTNGTKLASRSGSQDWILSLWMNWSIIISPVSQWQQHHRPWTQPRLHLVWKSCLWGAYISKQGNTVRCKER